MDGQSKPFEESKEAQFDLSLQGLDLKPFWDYVPVASKPKLTGGTFSCEIAFSFKQDGLRCAFPG